MSPRKMVQQKLTDILSASKKQSEGVRQSKKNLKTAEWDAAKEEVTVDKVDNELRESAVKSNESKELEFTNQLTTLEIEEVPPEELSVEEILQKFDLDYKYGPCIGIRRLDRWERAQRLGLNPPVVIKELLTKHPSLDKNIFHGDA
ncbi:10817_t:CDS:2 [Acaulospora colombiana]|uniref:10817_t:CDS:1 n=1 Tax=Acaulospora colombiana TaxID=27376 RepID=A0ACA9M1Z6_9GLOM|nr:10817_t:CDS:2 [Acaulospora colombiana]